MTSVGWATLDVIPTFKGLQGQLEKGTAAPMAAAGRSAGQKYGDAAGREAAGSFRSRVTGSLRGFAPFAGIAAGAGFTALFSGAVDEASAVAEAGSKVNVVFGSMSDEVRAFGENASEAFGQSDRQALSALGTFGNLLRAVGLTEAKAAEFSMRMVGLASDLASFNDTTVDEALLALRAGLVGETEPLKRFGVNLNEARLKAEAMAQGLSDGKGTLDATAKAQAAYALILKDTTLAQGDFQRTSDGLANSQRDLAADWADLRAELGEKLLPAATEFVQVLRDDALPALSAAGGVVADTAKAFDALPGPVKASAAALVGLKIASALGATDALTGGLARLRSGMETTRLRTMVAGDAYRTYRLNADAAAASNGRLGASFAAVRAGAAGAGSAVTRGLSGALGLVGGPWGAAFIAGTAVLTHFWQEHQKAKQYIEDVTASLDAQTGAVTENTREKVKQALQDQGILDRADDLGISLKLVTDAALGNTGALGYLERKAGDVQGTLADLTSEQGALNLANLEAKIATGEYASSVSLLLGPVREQAGIIADARKEVEQLARADGEAADETNKVTTATKRYSQTIDDARDKVQKLLDVENKRRNANLQDRRDRVALLDQIAAAREEAREGKKTLDENTKAGRENLNALFDLADQWENSSFKVRNAKGAYDEMRQNFIRVAEQMGATRTRARQLADELLTIPKKRVTEIETPGMEKALADLARLRALANLREFNRLRIQVGANQALAGGGLVGGVGSGTSDSNLIWASRGEFMQRKAAVDYYGVEFMRKLNSLQIPRYATGGPIGTAPTPRQAVQAGTTINHYGDIITERPRDYVTETRRKAIGGVAIRPPR